jgi:putative NADH-flavin reductase
MKIILLGATGNTGLQLAIQACKRGHGITYFLNKFNNLNLIQL